MSTFEGYRTTGADAPHYFVSWGPTMPKADCMRCHGPWSDGRHLPPNTDPRPAPWSKPRPRRRRVGGRPLPPSAA